MSFRPPPDAPFHPAVLATLVFGALYSITTIALAFTLAYRNFRKDTNNDMTDIFTVISNVRGRRWGIAAEQARALLYLVVPLIIAATDDTHSASWIGLASSILAPALASWKSATTLRTNLQLVIAALQGVLVGLRLLTDSTYTTWAQIALAVIGGGVAAANVHAR